MKNKQILILPITFLLISCGDNGPKYYQDYKSVTVRYFEATEERHFYNMKEMELENNLLSEWKDFIFEFINYGDKNNLLKIPNGLINDYFYTMEFYFEDSYDTFNFCKDYDVIFSEIKSENFYSKDRHPKIDSKITKKRSSLIDKLDEELEKIEGQIVEIWC